MIIYQRFVVAMGMASIFLFSASTYAQVKKSSSIVSVGDNREIKSLLFSSKDIGLIKSARSLYEKRRNNESDKFSEEDFLKKLERVTNLNELTFVDKLFTYPQFFLSSIAYYSEDDWVVWVNNRKIIKDDFSNKEALRVVGINKERVVFEWSPKRMDKIVDVGDYSSDSLVKVDPVRNIVIFSLRINQTFTSYAMRVVEGKVLPATIMIKKDALVGILGIK